MDKEKTVKELHIECYEALEAYIRKLNTLNSHKALTVVGLKAPDADHGMMEMNGHQYTFLQLLSAGVLLLGNSKELLEMVEEESLDFIVEKLKGEQLDS